MTEEGLSAEEQAEIDRRAAAAYATLDGASTNVCLSVLSMLAAQICAECDDPNEFGMLFMGGFACRLADRIDEIPAERIIDIPVPPETN